MESANTESLLDVHTPERAELAHRGCLPKVAKTMSQHLYQVTWRVAH